MTAAPPECSELLPFASHYFGAQPKRQHFIDEGTGAPVVMLHGNPTWCYYYRNLIERLRPNFRCIAPDHLGCGLSDAPSAEEYAYRLADRVDDLEALISDRLGDQPLTLVLHDWGGMIGMAWAHRHPQQVARFVILNTAGFPLPTTQPLPWQLRFARSRLGRWAIEHHNAFARIAARTAFESAVSAEVRAAYLAPYRPAGRRIATRRFVEDIPLTQSDPSYKIVAEVEAGLRQFCDRPALIGWGMKDFVFTEAFLDTWARHWPHAEVHRFNAAGHYVLEDAADPLIALIEDFVRA